MISIVTVNYNDSVGLKKTLDSVFSQNISRDQFQYIVVDGASTDGTLELMENCGVDTFLSEPDSGIFNAMNKGLSLSKGKHVLFLNAGDILYNKNVLSRLCKASVSSSKNTFIFGRVQVSSVDGWVFPPFKITALKIPKWLKFKQPHHQGCLFPIEFYQSNKYLEKFAVASDIDYKLRALEGGGALFLDEIVSVFDYSGVSSDIGDWDSFRLIHGELDEIYKEHEFSRRFRLRVLFNYTVKYSISLIGKKYLYSFLRFFYK